MSGSKATPAQDAATSLQILKKQCEKNKKLLLDKDASGRTPLHYASTNGHVAVVSFLLDQGVDLNGTDNDGWTALHCSCNEGHLQLSQFLMQKKANIHSPTSQGGTALHYAVRYHQNDPFSFLSLMHQFGDTIGFNVNAENHFGETPLASAVMRKNELAVVWLLKHGADPNIPNKKRVAPLHMACMLDLPNFVEMLLHKGAKATTPSDSGTPLQIATATSFTRILSMLSDHEQGRLGPSPLYMEIDALIEAFEESYARGNQCFAGPTPHMTVVFGRAVRFPVIDINIPVLELIRHLERLFNIPHDPEIVLFVQSPKAIASRALRSPFYALPLNDDSSIASQMPPDYVDGLMPSHYWLSLKRRRGLLCNPEEALNSITEKTEIADFDKLGKALVLLFEAAGRSDQLLKWAIALELKNTADNGTAMFREDSLTTKIITNYLRLLGRVYLHTMLGATIRTISSSHQVYEVDPNRPDAKKGNANKIKKLVKSFLSTIFKSLDYCPFQVWQLTHQIFEVVAQRSHESAFAATSAFLFLRCICPVIASPLSFGVLDEPPTPEAARGLILTAKILQNLANGVLFGDKEQYLIDMNKLIVKNMSPFKNFLMTLSTGEIPAAAPPASFLIDDEVEADAERTLDRYLTKKGGSSGILSPRGGNV